MFNFKSSSRYGHETVSQLDSDGVTYVTYMSVFDSCVHVNTYVVHTDKGGIIRRDLQSYGEALFNFGIQTFIHPGIKK